MKMNTFAKQNGERNSNDPGLDVIKACAVKHNVAVPDISSHGKEGQGVIIKLFDTMMEGCISSSPAREEAPSWGQQPDGSCQKQQPFSAFTSKNEDDSWIKIPDGTWQKLQSVSENPRESSNIP